MLFDQKPLQSYVTYTSCNRLVKNCPDRKNSAETEVLLGVMRRGIRTIVSLVKSIRRCVTYVSTIYEEHNQIKNVA